MIKSLIEGLKAKRLYSVTVGLLQIPIGQLK